MMNREERERSRAKEAGQEHVFRFWPALNESQREQLLSELEGVDYANVAVLQKALAGHGRSADDVSLEPPELFPLERASEQEEEAQAAAASGAELLSAGKVGYVLVAGGQASRLGYDGPKGDFPVGPVSGRTLFDFHARRLRAAARKFGTRVPWYVMTSPANDAATREIFEANQHFGLERDDVFFFVQSMLPALDAGGRILMASTSSLFLAPSGHGGVLEALARSGALDDMEARGVETISYFQVDNPLARPADPTFLGLHARAGAGMSSKVVAKRDANEKVGVLGRIDGRMGCIEYSDLPAELREATDERGQLLFRAGNIAVHALERAFVRELTREGLDLPWHVARKQVAVVDDEGVPGKREGFKFEAFVFDALGASRSSVTMEVARAEEFSPVKNAEGEDSPETSRRDLCALFEGWVRAAGHALPEPDGRGVVPLEVDPLRAEHEHEFLASEGGPEVTERGHLYA